MSRIEKTPTIMIVDDTPAILDLLDQMLRAQGYRALSYRFAGTNADKRADQAATQKNPKLLASVSPIHPNISNPLHS